MTVNQAIERLQQLKELGCGDAEIRLKEFREHAMLSFNVKFGYQKGEERKVIGICHDGVAETVAYE